MSAIQNYYIHEVYPYYKNYGLKQALPGVEKNPVSIDHIIEIHKNKIKEEANKNLKKKDKLDEDLYKYIQGIMGLSGEIVNTGMPREEFYNIQNAIEEVSGHKITQSINLTDADKVNSLQLKQEISKKANNLLKPSKTQSMISIKTINGYVNALNSIVGKPTDSKYASEFNKIVKRINDLWAKIQSDNNYQRSIKIDTFKGGKIKKTKDTGQLIALINEAYRYVNTGGVANKIGEVGELFGLLATYMYANDVKKVSQELLDELLAVKNKNPNVQSRFWVGQEGTKKLYRDEGLEINGSFTDPNSGAKYIVHGHPTQDKVDFQVEFPNSGKITFSMKNYANVSAMTILTGRLLPLLEQYQEFQYHYLNIVSTHNQDKIYYEDPKAERESSSVDLHKMHQAMILTIGFKSLVGGLTAMAKDGQIITTPYADYFMFNLNKKRGGISIYSTLDILNHALQLTDICKLFQVNGMDFNRISQTGIKSRSALDKSIHVQLLKAGLPKQDFVK